jgi:hypothetical protein
MKIQKRHPMLVEHPSQRKSNTHPRIFSPQPIRPRTIKAMMSNMITPMASIIYNIEHFLEKFKKEDLNHVFQFFKFLFHFLIFP